MEVHGTESFKSNALLEPYECFRFHEDIKTRQSTPIHRWGKLLEYNPLKMLANVDEYCSACCNYFLEPKGTVQHKDSNPILFFLSHKVYVFYGMFKS